MKKVATSVCNSITQVPHLVQRQPLHMVILRTEKLNSQRLKDLPKDTQLKLGFESKVHAFLIMLP